ncbi:hypothetical protein GWK08_03890 [Leptobacterium flavescens]|uniref:Thiopeptide-type bacteriocin biosynthesis domain-containing protein n=1 Tax=Leptobacterium flavescens TaxID=472055 RepID=A0A6P0UJI7_9FLAO|nr:thiopeptide-type bacteriocin biosynthesis protein [Leptobacterium flavescens]NER12570.1 hypothetical protein [Leptobacterium flavescens]
MENKTQRSFIIGDKWLYYKLYTGPKTADMILTEIVNPVATELIKQGAIDQWFFIRYADPKHHLRVRFHYNDPSRVAEIINALHIPFRSFIEEDLLWKIQLDTYQRELERYGDNTIEQAEELFFHDSKMIADFIDLIEGDEGEEIRWLFGLRAIDNLLDSFEYSEEGKLELLDNLKTGFGMEFGMSRPLKKQLDNKYRNARGKISEFLVFERENNPDFAPVLDVLDEKSANTKAVAKAILKHRDEGTLKMELNSLMGSYIHMLMNRLFKSNNRLHEMVCYDFLFRYYKSEWARKKYQKQKDSPVHG